MNANLPQGFWDHEIMTAGPPAADWLWDGFLARGNFTLVTGLWKAGKTTLLSLLLSRRKAGGTLAGLAVRSGKSIVVTEEPRAVWAARARQYDFGGQVYFLSQPFLSIPTPAEWQALIDHILLVQTEHGSDLVVLDPLAPLLRAENSPRHIFETLLPLRVLTERGVALLGMHHPAKGQPRLGQAARGSGALLGHVDISIEMRHPGGDPATRRRRILALSRHAETPRQLLLELNAEGTDYTAVPDEHADGFQASWDVLRRVLENAPQKLTCDDLLDEWPPDFDRPAPTTFRRWLERAVERSLIAREGAGLRTDPYRYWLPEREAVWRQDPFYEIFEQQRQQLNLPFESLREKKRRAGEGRHGSDGAGDES